MQGLDMQAGCGACPLEFEGTIDGVPFYFRSRGQTWTMGIGGDPVLEPRWFMRGPWGEPPFGAGWMPDHIGQAIVEKCCELWRVAGGPDGGKPKVPPRYAVLVKGAQVPEFWLGGAKGWTFNPARAAIFYTRESAAKAATEAEKALSPGMREYVTGQPYAVELTADVEEYSKLAPLELPPTTGDKPPA